MRSAEQRDRRIDLTKTTIVPSHPHRRGRWNDAQVTDAPCHQRGPAVAEAVIRKLDFDGLDRAHQLYALGDGVEVFCLLIDPEFRQRVDDGADARSVDADLSEQACVLNALYQVNDVTDIFRQADQLALSGFAVAKFGQRSFRFELIVVLDVCLAPFDANVTD